MCKDYVRKFPCEMNNNIAQIVTDTDEVIAQRVVTLYSGDSGDVDIIAVVFNRL